MLEEVAKHINNPIAMFKAVGEKSVENVYFDKKGIMYCKKCNTPKSCIVEGHHCPVPCKCEREKQEEAERQKRVEENKRRFFSAQNFSMMGKKYLGARFSLAKITENNKVAYEKLKNYAVYAKEMKEESIGLYIYGDNSSGKSYATACLCNTLLAKGYKCIFTNLATIMRKLYDKEKEMSFEEIIDRFKNSDFVFLDDVGKEFMGREFDGTKKKGTEELFFQILNAIYNEEIPIIYSSNYSMQELRDVLQMDKAIVERINETATDVILLTGDDFRSMAIEEKQKILKKYGV